MYVSACMSYAGLINFCLLKSSTWWYGPLKAPPSSPFFLQYQVQQSATKGRKSEVSPLHGCAGWREGHSETQTAAKCSGLSWHSQGAEWLWVFLLLPSASPPPLWGKVFWRLFRGSSWAREPPSWAVLKALPWEHIWAPVLLLDRGPGVTGWGFLY